MTEKQSILGRISQLAGTDVSALLTSTTDPGAMLDQLVRDFTATIAEAEEALAVVEANLRLAELDREEDHAAARAWGAAAQASWDRGDELRARDSHSNPTAFDALAESARSKQYAAEGAAAEVDTLISAQRSTAAALTDALAFMRSTLKGLKDGRKELVAGASDAEAAGRVPNSSVNVMDPATDLARFEALLQAEIARTFERPDAAADVEEHLTLGDAEVAEGDSTGVDLPDEGTDPTPEHQ